MVKKIGIGTIVILILLGAIVSLGKNDSGQKSSAKLKVESAAKSSATPTQVVTPTLIPTKKPTSTPTPEPKQTTPAPTQVKQAENQNISPASSETISQKNAINKAISYLGYSAFSHDGLVAQLEYEQFSHADAVYGADNSGANWNEQAARKAKQYMEYSAFSRGSLIEQLKYEKFTQEQAEYGANAVGL